MRLEIVWLILGGALATYGIRWAGYAMLTRFKRLDPRIVAGMNAVPAAVLTAIIAPGVAEGGPAEIGALAVTILLALAGSKGTVSFLGGCLALILFRNFSG